MLFMVVVIILAAFKYYEAALIVMAISLYLTDRLTFQLAATVRDLVGRYTQPARFVPPAANDGRGK